MRRLPIRGAGPRLAAACAVLALADSARALPVVFAVDPGRSQVAASIRQPFPSLADQTVDLSGSVAGDVGFDVSPFNGLVVSQLRADSALLALTDAAFVLAAPPGTSFTISGTGIGASLSSPGVAGFSVAPGISLIDLFGSQLVYDSGSLVISGMSFGDAVDVLVDLSNDPLAFEFPLNALAQMTLVELGGGLVDLELDVPLNLETTIFPDGIPTTYAVQGSLVLTAQVLVPEPATGCLVGFGLLAAAACRRLRRRHAGRGAAVLGLAMAALLLAPAARALTFTVNSTADASDASPGNGVCLSAGLVCTLRAALEEANALAGADTVEFAIPGIGLHTIGVGATDLPGITEALLVDGFSQPLSQANTLAVGSDALFLVEIDGGGVAGNGFSLLGDGIRVRGLVVRGFMFAGFEIQGADANVTGCRVLENFVGISAFAFSLPDPDTRIGGPNPADRVVVSRNTTDGINLFSGAVVQNAYVGTDAQGAAADPNARGIVIASATSVVDSLISGNAGAGLEIQGQAIEILGNRIGTDATGMLGVSNGGPGIAITAGSDVQIGAEGFASRNLISGNNGAAGIDVSNGQDVRIHNNWIGLDAAGGPLANFIPLEILGGVDIEVGGVTSILGSLGNVIAFNSNPIIVRGFGGISFLGNEIFNNASSIGVGGGIDHGGDGFTANDPGDLDGIQNFPELTDARLNVGGTRVVGRLDSRPLGTYRLEFFSSLGCDLTGKGQGQSFLGGFDVTADATGTARFDRVLARTVPSPVITATATDSGGDTSEFSVCFDPRVAGSADLRVQKHVAPLGVGAGEPADFTITLTNLGPGVATGVQVQDLLSPELELLGHVASLGSYDPVSGVWDAGDVAVQAPETLTLTVTPKNPVPAFILNAASLLALDQIEPNGTNDVATASLEVRVGADLEILLEVSEPGPDVGETTFVTATVTNLGPEDATGVVVQLHRASYTQFTPSATNVLSFGPFDLADGAMMEFEAEVLVTSLPPAALGQKTTLQGGIATSRPLDPQLENNVHAVEFGLGGAADLSCTMDYAGSVYFATLHNGGPDDALGAQISTNGFRTRAADTTIVAPGLDCDNFITVSYDCKAQAPLPAGSSLRLEVRGLNEKTPLFYTCDASALSFDPFPDNNVFFARSCFIATAAYGSWLDPRLDTLRGFRDEVLAPHVLGRAFIARYYRWSPPIAAAIARHESLRFATRTALAPLVAAIEYPRWAGAAAALGLVSLTLAGAARRRR